MNPILVTSIFSFFGFALNGIVATVLLLQSRELYHKLFAMIASIIAVWDFGIFLTMIRNTHGNEVVIYGYIITAPTTFLPALVYHFTHNYLRQQKLKSTLFFWICCSISVALLAAGFLGRISEVRSYPWGNFFLYDTKGRYSLSFWLVFYVFILFSSCWSLLSAYGRELEPVKRRHILYVCISLFVFSLGLTKLVIFYGINMPSLLSIGMFFTSIFAALIAIAILKYQLFDITLIIKKGAIYSALAAFLVFLFTLSEHFITSYAAHLFGEESTYIHFISVSIIVAMFMPIKNKLERKIGRYFSRKKIEF